MLRKAEDVCKSAEEDAAHHFIHVAEMIELGEGAMREVESIHLL